MTRAVVLLNSRAERERIIRWVGMAPDGTRVEMKAPRRSLDQNSLMWARLTEISRQVSWYGQYLSAEDWKDVMSASLRKARVVPGLDPGTYVPLGMRTSDMSKEEMGHLLDLIDAFAAEHHVKFSEPEAGGDRGGAMNKQFPRGKAAQDDEGALPMAISHSNGIVRIDFFKKIAWIAFEPDLAEAFANAILARAKRARAEAQ